MGKAQTRQAKILELVDVNGFVSTEGLVAALDVTPQTIRRDINELCNAKLLQRFHGGAGRRTNTENDTYPERKKIASKGKRMIGEMVAARIRPGTSLFINIGTTTEAVATALIETNELRVITNNINVAQILSGNPTASISVSGGTLRKRDGGLVGNMATQFLSQFQADFGIVGVSGITEDGHLLDFDDREIENAKAIIKNSNKVFLVADQSKFGRRAMMRFGDFSDIDELFTDTPPGPAFAKALSDAGVIVNIVGQHVT